jgi:hypothetical protein
MISIHTCVKANPISETPTEPLNWKWCAKCQRCYGRAGDVPICATSSCPYPDCDGEPLICEWDWAAIYRTESSFPSEPKLGHIYQIYD